jgi:hypothetical protein
MESFNNHAKVYEQHAHEYKWYLKNGKSTKFRSCHRYDWQAQQFPKLNLVHVDLMRGVNVSIHDEKIPKYVLKSTKKYIVPSRNSTCDSMTLLCSRGRSNAFHHTTTKTNISNTSYEKRISRMSSYAEWGMLLAPGIHKVAMVKWSFSVRIHAK